MTKIIDLSNNNSGAVTDAQGNVNLPDADGYIFKASGGPSYTDTWVKRYISAANAKGKPWGLYHFAVDGFTHDSHTVQDEVNQFVRVVKDIGGSPAYLFLDFESVALNTWSVDNVNQFLDSAKAALGRDVGIYTSASPASTFGWHGTSKDAKFWIAAYQSNKPNIPGLNMVGWQYTDSPVDTSEWYEAFQGAGGGNSSTPSVSRSTTASTGNVWMDSLGDTWHGQVGKVVLWDNVHLRWGARTTSSVIALLPPYAVVDYDAYSYHDGYVWVRQPRGNGEYGYLATGTCEGTRTTENWVQWLSK